MNQTINNRSEILFLYDVKDANPNGDPVDENKPRIDEETGINLVTDVRLKRTIRDYLHDFKGQEIFVIEETHPDGKLKTKEDRMKIYEDDPEKVKEKCIDIRLFGATTAVKDKTMTLTGPVQFKFGRSLHRVDLTYYKGTTIMPSTAGAQQGTFWEKYILPYSLIAFYGVINENAAKLQNINLTQQDIDLMLEAMWNGTRNLISGSKFGQVPRLLIQVVYKENLDYHIGELDKLVNLQTSKGHEEVRDVTDFQIDITNLVNMLKQNSDRIEKIRYKIDSRLQLSQNGFASDVATSFNFVPIEQFSF